MQNYTKEDALRIIDQHPEKRAHHLFKESPYPIAYFSTRGEFLIANDALCDFLELSNLEIQEKTFTEVTHPEDIGIDWANLKKLERGELDPDNYKMYKRYITKTGKILPVCLSVYPIRDDKHQVIYYISFTRPIDEHKNFFGEIKNIDSKLDKNTKEYIFDFVVANWQKILAALLAIAALYTHVADLKETIEKNTEIREEENNVNKSFLKLIQELKEDRNVQSKK